MPAPGADGTATRVVPHVMAHTAARAFASRLSRASDPDEPGLDEAAPDQAEDDDTTLIRPPKKPGEASPEQRDDDAGEADETA